MLYLYQDLIIQNLKRHAKEDKNLHQIIIYGSFARNEHRPESDIDILIITDDILESERIFSKFRNNIYLETSVIMSFQYLRPLEYANRKDPFMNQIKKEGKIIWSINKTI